MLYHGSNNPNLIEEITSNGVGIGTECSGLFFTCSLTHAKYYGKYLYCMSEELLKPSDFFDERDVTGDMLGPLMREHGIEYSEHIDLCWSAVVSESLAPDEYDAWVELASTSPTTYVDAAWFAQSLRIELARRMGCKAVGMEDECGSIVVLREHIVLERVEICPECGEDKNGEDCDCE